MNGKVDPMTCEALVNKLADALRLCADLMVTILAVSRQDPISTGGGTKGGGGPHLEALLNQCHRFDLAVREIDGLVLKVESEAKSPK